MGEFSEEYWDISYQSFSFLHLSNKYWVPIMPGTVLSTEYALLNKVFSRMLDSKIYK